MTLQPALASSAIATEPTPPAAPVTIAGPIDGRHPGRFEREHAEHRGIAGGADRHRLGAGQTRRAA